jgi:PAS domain S-box-containing protein
MVQALVEHGMVRNFEAQFKIDDGQLRDCLISARLLSLHGELHMLAVYRDISEYKEAIRALRESEEKFRSVYETIPDVISITRLRDGLIVDLNPAIEELSGVPRTHFIGRSSIEMKSWANPADRDRMVQHVIAHGSIRNMEAQLNTGIGQLRDCLVSARLMQLQGEPHILTVFKDISDQKAALRALGEREAQFRLIFEASPDPLIIATAHGGIIQVNRAFVTNSGISAEEATGKTGHELDLWADPEQRSEFIQRLQQDGEVIGMEAQFRKKNGEIRTGLTSARMITIGGEPCMLIGIRDITVQKRSEQAMVEMDRMKSEFISTAAHELRTPLATILGYTELLLTPNDFGGFSADHQTEFLEEIYLKGEMLSKIIDEMLDISRIEGGHSIPLDLQPHEPNAMLAKILRRFERQSPKHSWRLDLSGAQPAALKCDLHRMTQVLENLLSNAVKYSPSGGTITVKGEIIADEYVISVIDQGIGMSREQMMRIFDKFYRADSSNTAIGGLGLGMSIARQIVENHGGRIWLESELGSGTTIYCALPITAVNGEGI